MITKNLLKEYQQNLRVAARSLRLCTKHPEGVVALNAWIDDNACEYKSAIDFLTLFPIIEHPKKPGVLLAQGNGGEQWTWRDKAWHHKSEAAHY